MITGRDEGFVFGRSARTPFQSGTINARALRCWEQVGLSAIGLHEARHTAVSFWIAAGLNVKSVSVYMGHASVALTLDRYGHLLPGNEAESVERIDAFIDRAMTSRRLDALAEGSARLALS